MGSRTLVKKVIPQSLFRKIEPYGHWVEAVLAQQRAGFPARDMKVIGVTGTDGKTTTCTLIAQMLRQSGYKVALITTVYVDYADGKGPRPSPTHLTTASVGQLVGMLKKIKQNQPDWVVIEASSHALVQRRVWGIPFSVAVLTNMSHEHLDYHGTFENYVKAKQLLFQQCNHNKKGLRVGVINADDKTAPGFAAKIANPVLYGVKKGDVHPSNVVTTTSGSSYQLTVGDTTYQIKTQLPGDFNVYNSLAAVAVGRAVGLTPSQIEEGIASLTHVAGRMMPVEHKGNFDVYVDYAVTPKALEEVLKTSQKLAKGKVSIVFGATGDRDRSKRPVMGEIVAKYADKIYLTDDETYTENPETIRSAVMKGVTKAGGTSKTTEYTDRREAIVAAVGEAKPGDIILLTGLGHQTTRNMGGKEEPWSDTEVVTELLEQKK